MKKKLLWIWLGFELVGLIIALPAAAQIVDHVFFRAVPRAAHVVTQIRPGESEILIASNAPFVILTKGAIGDMQVSLSVQGRVNGVAYGQNAQSPGPARTCASAVSPAPSIIYQARRKTAANRGEVIAQAVKFTISYNPALHPKFQVKTLDQDAAKTAQSASPCHPEVGQG